MRPLYGDAKDIQERAERAEELARHANAEPEDIKEPTVEQCLDELRQMFPERDGLQVTEHAWFWRQRGRTQRSARIMLGPGLDAPKFGTEGEAPLAALMDQVRKWKQEHS